MRTSLALSAILAFAVLLPALPAVAASVNDFIVHSFLDSNNNVLLPGRLHIPAEFATDPNTPRPLIIFLHGAGESGTNNLLQINGNIDNLLAAAKTRGAFLYAPQTNAGWQGPTNLSRAITMIDRAIADFHADPNRIYVTGLSMGGGGTWNVLNQYPDRFAAAVPICGVAPAPSSSFTNPALGFQPANIIDKAIWAFHGRNDTTVSVTVTRNVINSLLTEAGQSIPTYPPVNAPRTPHIRFDFPPLDLHYTDMFGGHGIWFDVYNQALNADMYNWLFAHTQIPEPATLVLTLFALWPLAMHRTRSGPR